MFGFYRTFLALLVVAHHLGGFSGLGSYAVFGFYMLSGYLITHITQETYGYSHTGIKKYLLNRFLRIYPAYWVACILTVIVVIALPTEIGQFHKALKLPESSLEYLANFAIAFKNLETARLVPPAWALTVEIIFYLLIGLGLSKNQTITNVWLGLSILYHILINFFDAGWYWVYFSVLGASLPFALGAFVYHHKQKLLKTLPFNSQKSLCLLFMLLLANWSLGNYLGLQRSAFLYFNLLICLIIMLMLFNKQSLMGISKKLDAKIGAYSFPIYLLHYLAGFLTLMIFNTVGYEVHNKTVELMFLSLPALFLLSWVMIYLIEQKIEAIRRKVKEKNSNRYRISAE